MLSSGMYRVMQTNKSPLGRNDASQKTLQKESINKVAIRQKSNRNQTGKGLKTKRLPKKDCKRTEKRTENHQKLIEKLTEKAPKGYK